MTIKFTTGDEPNKTLKGHVLLIIVPPVFKPDTTGLKRRFPDLRVVYHEQQWGVRTVPDRIVPAGDDDGEVDWAEVTILLTGTALPTVKQAPRLQYVQLLSAGADYALKSPLFLDTDIDFCTANGVHGPQISEWVISTYLSFQHSLPKYMDLQREEKWERGTDMVDDSVGRRVGILGYGSIGRQTARLATALGMSVHAYTLHPRDTPASRRDESYTPPGLGDPEGVLPEKWFSGASKADLHAFLGSGLDLLLVATPLTDKSRHLLGREEFDVLAAASSSGKRKGAFLSNIARGPVVDTDALIEALDKGGLRGAALDVTDPEPLPQGHPLWKAKNVIITPHVSGGSTAYGQRVFAILELNLGRLSEGKTLTNRVSRKDGY